MHKGVSHLVGLAQIGREVGRKGGCWALGLGEAGREAAQARRGQRAGERARPILNRCSQQGKERLALALARAGQEAGRGGAA